MIDCLTWMRGETGLGRDRKKGRGRKKKRKKEKKTAAGIRIVVPPTVNDVISLIWHRCASLVREKMKK